MNKKRFFTVLVAVFCISLVAAKPNVDNPTKSISKQIKSMLASNFIEVDAKDLTARVLFKVNESGEIQLLRVASERKDVKQFIDKKLEGEKLEVSTNQLEKVYVLDVRVKA